MYSYPLASYTVTTKDGYILKLFRIPGPKNTSLKSFKFDPNRKVVLFQHGLLDSSDSWVGNYEKFAAPFILANKGYDVWLGNNRGNKYSRNHIKLDPRKDKEFWKFSMHEMGTIDLPTMFDFILKETGRKKISYIGHSQGTAQMFIALSLNPDYFSERLNAFMAFGPVTNLHNVSSSFLQVVAKTRVDNLLLSLNIFNEFLPDAAAIEVLQKYVCKTFGFLCNGILDIISDANPNDNDPKRFLVFLTHYPSGASLQTIHHFAENIRNNIFAPIDSKIPYPLEKIKDIPICLFVGKDDRLATIADNRGLKEVLAKNGSITFYKEYDDMGHATFFLSKTNEHVNDMLPILEKLNENSS